jgi:hypothetical protein
MREWERARKRLGGARERKNEVSSSVFLVKKSSLIQSTFLCLLAIGHSHALHACGNGHEAICNYSRRGILLKISSLMYVQIITSRVWRGVRVAAQARRPPRWQPTRSVPWSRSTANSTTADQSARPLDHRMKMGVDGNNEAEMVSMTGKKLCGVEKVKKNSM